MDKEVIGHLHPEMVVKSSVSTDTSDKWCPLGDQCYSMSSLVTQTNGSSAPSASLQMTAC